jgi:hypothetical protein
LTDSQKAFAGFRELTTCGSLTLMKPTPRRLVCGHWIACLKGSKRLARALLALLYCRPFTAAAPRQLRNLGVGLQHDDRVVLLQQCGVGVLKPGLSSRRLSKRGYAQAQQQPGIALLFD